MSIGTVHIFTGYLTKVSPKIVKFSENVYLSALSNKDDDGNGTYFRMHPRGRKPAQGFCAAVATAP